MFRTIFKQKSEKFIPLSDANANDFRGEWLAVVDNRIVAHDMELSNAIKTAVKNFKGKKIKYSRVPSSNIAMY